MHIGINFSGKNFGNNLVKNIAQRNGLEILKCINMNFFGNESNRRNFSPFGEIVFDEERSDSFTNYGTRNRPSVLIKCKIKAIRFRSRRGVTRNDGHKNFIIANSSNKKLLGFIR